MSREPLTRAAVGLARGPDPITFAQTALLGLAEKAGAAR
jgi:hypothetical protein